MHERLKKFFSPENVAVIGASTRNQWFFNIAGNAKMAGFRGHFHPVNPGAGEVFGMKAVQRVSELPGNIDFATVILKSSLVLRTLDELAGRGIRNILLISSGFAEAGPDGERLQEDLRTLCRQKDILLMGPNCLGFMNLGRRMSIFAGGSVEGEFAPGSIGLLGQSGATSEIIATKIFKKGLGLSLYVTTGNEALLTSEDCLDYMIAGGGTKVVIGFMEGFRDIPRMKRLALEAARKRIPIILIKVGCSEKGIQAARSHTGALAGDAGVMEGFFRQYGIIRVETIEELVETAGIFSRCELPRGPRVGIATFSGGLAGLYADLCSRLGIELADLSPASVHALKALLPEFAQPANPLDVTGSGFTSGMDTVVKTLLEDENIDILVPVSFPPAAQADTFSDGFNQCFLPMLHAAGKPVIPITFREVSEYARRYYRDHGVYFIEHVQDGFKALAHLVGYARFQQALGSGSVLSA